ncbi:MAG: TetR family transcriptional regulator [Actinophytocola sp.]|uniref:TetR/AcrR family transcriptional regulator n=1 Tax=Actinophytocola sp. TaxID=1872138 RepID=UPI001328D171|nr:TetR/AcrR family transcriptional regulator [Actinophytocola sp.]MPZ85505.1 TetR family transcriptional regulator [Actinophytocola sp.]
MSDGVKKKRQQPRETRRRIIAAAADLFVAQGYAATKLEEVATRADVAVQTVYFHFTNKHTLLKEAVDVASVGDDEPVPVLERPFVQEIRDEPDPRRALAIWTATSRAIFERVAPIMQAVRDAAGTNAEMAAQWEVNQTQRATAHRMLAELIDEKRALKDGLAVDRAADIIFGLISPELYLLLTVRCGWSAAEWESWITETVADAVLR